MRTQQTYRAGIYCRLSVDDGTQNESMSIGNQRHMLTDYARRNGWQIADFYVDDGYSGVNFDRPDFQRLISDIEAGKIDLVIVKDLSRLGRNYILCGQYTEIYFPEKNVRFIALNDGIDTLYSNNDIAPFKNILNEILAQRRENLIPISPPRFHSIATCPPQIRKRWAVVYPSSLVRSSASARSVSSRSLLSSRALSGKCN